MHSLISELYPICRSITGEGVHQTLAALQREIPLSISEVPSGTEVFDWTVPKEWNIRDAYIQDSNGNRVVDFRQSNLHVLSYSVPIQAYMTLEELKPHLFTLPEHPDWIPYRTSYYKEDWGFCLSHRQMLSLAEDRYEVRIDSSLEPGRLTYGECFLQGQTEEEVLISCHICHPSLANDNLSGIAVAVFLAKYLASMPLRYSYRFLFIPGTIGAITWLALNQDRARRIQHGLVLTNLGDPNGFHYKKSRRGNTEIDRAVAHVLKHSGRPYQILDFFPHGSDERQYCSPGFNLAVGCLMRTVWGQFPEYHSSADNLDFVQPLPLAESLCICIQVVDLLENNRKFVTQYPFCEPQLGKRSLYGLAGSTDNLARLWLLNLSDGDHSLLDIAERSGLPFHVLRDAAQLLCEHHLLRTA
ncbi:MAG: DUF4910 domain-containing protein [Acidobacteria bacterium]|nr:DUF4910 domain-containing protein [Acidobacteriota bacterium]